MEIWEYFESTESIPQMQMTANNAIYSVQEVIVSKQSYPDQAWAYPQVAKAAISLALIKTGRNIPWIHIVGKQITQI